MSVKSCVPVLFLLLLFVCFGLCICFALFVVLWLVGRGEGVCMFILLLKDTVDSVGAVEFQELCESLLQLIS